MKIFTVLVQDDVCAKVIAVHMDEANAVNVAKKYIADKCDELARNNDGRAPETFGDDASDYIKDVVFSETIEVNPDKPIADIMIVVQSFDVVDPANVRDEENAPAHP